MKEPLTPFGWRRCAGAAALVAALGLPPCVFAQAGLYAYPTAGQGEQQQRQDRFECHEWSVNQTGFNPNTAQASAPSGGGYSAPPPSQSGFFGKGQAGQGGVVRDSAGGATLGLIGGAIAGDAGKGAAIGAVSGALFGGIRRGQRNQERAQYEAHQRAQQEQIRRQQESQIARGTEEYRRAWSACMRARKYDVQ
jgi:hypothetical protein